MDEVERWAQRELTRMQDTSSLRPEPPYAGAVGPDPAGAAQGAYGVGVAVVELGRWAVGALTGRWRRRRSGPAS